MSSAMPCLSFSACPSLSDRPCPAVPYRAVPYRAALHRTALHRTVSYRTTPPAPHCNVPYRTVPSGKSRLVIVHDKNWNLFFPITSCLSRGLGMVISTQGNSFPCVPFPISVGSDIYSPVDQAIRCLYGWAVPHVRTVMRDSIPLQASWTKVRHFTRGDCRCP